MEIKEFIRKVEERGYSAEHRYTQLYLGEVIVSKDNYYHVPVPVHDVRKVPFDVIMHLVNMEIERLKTEK